MEDELDALEAIHMWRAKGCKNLLSDETLICECMCISVLDIREFFKTSQASQTVDVIDYEILKEQLDIGQGCQSCLKSFEQWKDKIF